MIYGLVPVGGKGTRLGLPFPKELLPQKGYDCYKPLIAHTTEKMEEAGAEVIYFIHGTELKQGIVDYYSDTAKYVHIIQQTIGFANVLLDFYSACNPQDLDTIFFGLPDSIYEDNPFIRLQQHNGIVCGLFITDNPETKVDRLTTDTMGFQIKSPKRDDNQDWFWGVLKFDGCSLKHINSSLISFKEIGAILNGMPHLLIKNGFYTDLGTWVDYNKYLSNNILRGIYND